MKALRCRIGDLCVVVRASHRANLGHIVQVIAHYDPAEDDLGMHGADWFVTCAVPLTWSQGKKRWRRRRGPVPDECLKPIRGNGKLRSINRAESEPVLAVEDTCSNTMAGT